MKQAYMNMRNFWLDVKNLENRKGVIEIGPDEISGRRGNKTFVFSD